MLTEQEIYRLIGLEDPVEFARAAYAAPTYPQRSGRTTKMLVSALCAAQDRDRVVAIVCVHRQVQSFKHTLHSWSEKTGICIDNIRFVTTGERLCGIDAAAYCDHEWLDRFFTGDYAVPPAGWLQCLQMSSRARTIGDPHNLAWREIEDER